MKKLLLCLALAGCNRGEVAAKDQEIATLRDQVKALEQDLQIVRAAAAAAPPRPQEPPRPVSSEVERTLKNRVLDIERVLGHHIVDDYGNLTDPVGTLRELHRFSFRRHGGNEAVMRRALMNTFGNETGLAIFRAE